MSSGPGGQASGVYWMFYSGGSLEETSVPKGLPGVPEGSTIKGLKTRPGLAMSQVHGRLLVNECCESMIKCKTMRSCSEFLVGLVKA